MDFICDLYSAMKISSNIISRKIDISCPKWFKIDHSVAWFIVRFMSHSRYHAESGALLVLLYHVEYCDNMFYYVMMCEFICLYRFIKNLEMKKIQRVLLCCLLNFNPLTKYVTSKTFNKSITSHPSSKDILEDQDRHHATNWSDWAFVM